MNHIRHDDPEEGTQVLDQMNKPLKEPMGKVFQNNRGLFKSFKYEKPGVSIIWILIIKSIFPSNYILHYNKIGVYDIYWDSIPQFSIDITPRIKALLKVIYELREPGLWLM